jgi:hypothetical protein
MAIVALLLTLFLAAPSLASGPPPPRACRRGPDARVTHVENGTIAACTSRSDLDLTRCEYTVAGYPPIVLSNPPPATRFEVTLPFTGETGSEYPYSAWCENAAGRSEVSEGRLRFAPDGGAGSAPGAPRILP